MLLVRDGPRALHEQVAEAIREEIRSLRWPEHYKLPAESQLAEELEISRGTLRRALRSLVDEGLLVQVHGRGTFVTAKVADLPIAQRLVSLHEILSDAGWIFTTEVLERTIGRGPDRVRSLLHASADERLLKLRRRLVVDGVPFVALDNFVRVDLCPRLEHLDFVAEPLFRAIEDCGLTIGWGQRNFAATLAGDLAQLLETEATEPVLYLEQITFLDDERPVEYSDVWVRGEKLRISTILQR